MDESFVVIRLTALWAFSEAGLGGLLHLFRSPFTGLLVGSISVMIISLIAYSSKKPYINITKSLLLVLMIKMTISPHSPIPAYFAVSFQGLLAAGLFTVISHFRTACLILGLLALAESALQKLLTLTIIFGESIWDAIDLFVKHVSSKFSIVGFEQGSLWLIVSYVSFYAFAGLFVGWIAGNLPSRIDENLSKLNNLSVVLIPEKKQNRKPSFWKSKKTRLLTLLFILVLAAYYLFPEAKAILDPVWLLLRVFLVLSIWYLFIGPFLLEVFRKYLNKRTGQYREEVQEALSLLPVFRLAFFQIWRSHKEKSFFKKLRASLFDIISFSLLYKSTDDDTA